MQNLINAINDLVKFNVEIKMLLLAQQKNLKQY